MKRLMIFMLLLLAPVILMAQEIPVPDNIISVFADLNGWFSSTIAVAGLTLFFTMFVVKAWKNISAIMKQVVALVIAVLLMTIGNFANIGFMAEFTWYSTITYGLITGFIANGWYDLKNITK